MAAENSFANWARRLISKQSLMRCKNSPSILNALEAKILETTPANARHVLVLNAGDGRLPRAIREKLGDVVVTTVHVQPGMAGYVNDIGGISISPWDIEWLSGRVAAHGSLDLVVVYNLHEIWQGQLHQFQRLLQFVRPGGLVWTSLLNAQSQGMLSRFLPPVRLSYAALADSLRIAPSIDLASFLDFVSRAGGAVQELWGLLDQNAQDFCQQPPKSPASWDIRGIKVSISTFADAFLWGAAVVGVAFRTPGSQAETTSPVISFSPYNPTLAQALLATYPEVQNTESALATAYFEVEAWKRSPSESFGSLPRLLLEQMGSAAAGTRRVLLVGCGWGRDLLLLKKQKPEWDCVGYESNSALSALGGDVCKAAGVEVVSSPLDGVLPFAEKSFDLVISLGFFSSIYQEAAHAFVRELVRISKDGVYHLEDGRGPEHSIYLKAYSLTAIYADLGKQTAVQPVLVDGTPIGMYMLKVSFET